MNESRRKKGAYSQQLEEFANKMASLFKRTCEAHTATQPEDLEELWNECEELLHQLDKELIPATADGVKQQLVSLVEQTPEIPLDKHWQTALLCVILQNRLGAQLTLAEEAQICLRLAELNKRLGKKEKALRWAYEACALGYDCFDPDGKIAARDAGLLIEGLGRENPLS